MVKIRFSKGFRKTHRKLPKQTRLRILKILINLKVNPELGKPLKNKFKNQRSLRLDPFRIIYRHEGDIIYILTLEHRSDVYK